MSKQSFRAIFVAIFVAALVFNPLSVHASSVAVVGDLDGDHSVNFEDVLTGLRVMGDLSTSQISPLGDVDGDSAIGLSDVLYVLRTIGSPRAMIFGPLSGATLNVYSVSDPDTAYYTATTEENGSFVSAPLSSLEPGTLVLLTASGGSDMLSEVQNQGTLHALITVEDYNSRSARVSILTDIAWRYTKNLIGKAPVDEILARLDYLATVFLAADLTGDGKIDAKDLQAFDPGNQVHRDALSFDFTDLTDVGLEGHSVLTCYYENQEENLLALLDDAFGSRLSLYPGASLASEQVSVHLLATGQGSVSSNVGGFAYDASDPEWDDSTQQAFLARSESDSITFTATPAAEAKILSWNGCDDVSEDLRTCRCLLSHDRMASVAFGYSETKLEPDASLFDLSTAEVTAGADQVMLTVTAATGDTAMAYTLTTIAPNDCVVGTQGVGFLRRVLFITDLGSGVYLLETDNASLDDVIEEGSADLSVRMTNEDVLPPDKNSASSAGGTLSLFGGTGTSPSDGTGFVGVETVDGVLFVPSDNPTDSRFRFLIGAEPPKGASVQDDLSVSDSITFVDPNTGVEVTVSGAVEVGLGIDFDVDFGLSGLKSFRFVPVVDASEELSVEFSGSLTKAMREEIATMHFSPITFFIGPVPVVVMPTLTVFLGLDAESGGVITAGIELTQVARGGILWTRQLGIEPVLGFEPGYTFTPPTIHAYAEAKAYVEPQVSMLLYGATGPGVGIQSYLRLRGELAGSFNNDLCNDGLNLSAYWGVDAAFVWDLGLARKLSSLIGMETPSLRYSLYRRENLIKRWNREGTCANLPPYLELSGSPEITASVSFGSNQTLVYAYTVENTGDQTLNWEARPLVPDGRMTFDNQSGLSGSLGKGETDAVTVRVNTAGLNTGEYRNRIVFENQSDTTEADGTQYIPVRVDITQTTGGSLYTNTIGQTFVYIEPGTFTMGSPTNELGRGSDETQHEVTLTQGFYMMTTEVTQGQWRAVMGNSPSRFSNCGSDCPVERVSWNDVQTFISTLNSLEGTDRYRLPTEAEWEYAARAGTQTSLPNGAISVTGCEYDPNLVEIGWYCYNSEVAYSGCFDNTQNSVGGSPCSGTHPVKQKLPNNWGLYDVIGNVWEWCSDWYGDYPTGAVTDPTGPTSGSVRVFRGGNWYFHAMNSRSASRHMATPDYIGFHVGFRLVANP